MNAGASNRDIVGTTENIVYTPVTYGCLMEWDTADIVKPAWYPSVSSTSFCRVPKLWSRPFQIISNNGESYQR